MCDNLFIFFFWYEKRTFSAAKPRGLNFAGTYYMGVNYYIILPRLVQNFVLQYWTSLADYTYALFDNYFDFLFSSFSHLWLWIQIFITRNHFDIMVKMNEIVKETHKGGCRITLNFFKCDYF